jgi:hypothetical protein
MYEMQVGYPPFYGDNPFVVYQKILDGKFSLPSNLTVTGGHPLAKPLGNVITSLIVANRVNRLGCGVGGHERFRRHPFFRGVDWTAAERQLLVPLMVPTVMAEGDTSNYDIYPEDLVEEVANLTTQQREKFAEIESLLTPSLG